MYKPSRGWNDDQEKKVILARFAEVDRAMADADEAQTGLDSTGDATPCADLAIVDMSPWLMPERHSDEQRAVAVADLMHGMETIGLVLIKGHGVSASLLEQAQLAEHEFSQLPRKAKQALVGKGKIRRGWIDGGWIQFHYMGPRELYGQPDASFQDLGPDAVAKLQAFKEAMCRYYAEMERVEDALLCMTSVGLGCEPDTLKGMVGKHKGLLQSTIYPGVSDRPSSIVKGVPHADYLSLLGIGWPHDSGLEVLNHRTWQTVPVVPGTFEVIVGDLLSRLSNGRFTSSIHRVRCAGNRQRNSTLYFAAQALDPSDNTVCEPICGRAEEPKFQPMSFNDFNGCFLKVYAESSPDPERSRL